MARAIYGDGPRMIARVNIVPKILKLAGKQRFEYFGDNIDASNHARTIAVDSTGQVLAVGAPGDDVDAVGVNGSAISNGLTDAGAGYIFYF